MISEDEVLTALPYDSWLTKYVQYCQMQTTSPLAYHLGVGLTILAMSCPTEYTMRFFGKMPCNMFALLAGRSGEDQKSTALGFGEELLDMANFKLIGDQPASAEGLVNSLSEDNKQCIFYSEFGQFLSQSKGGYMESIKTTYTNLWDGKNITRKKANETIRAENPRLSIVAACSLPYLEQYTTAHDWSGGFMGRWLLMFAKRERTMAFPPDETEKTRNMRNYLAGTLQEFMRYSYSERCLGLDEEAKELWSEWYCELQKRPLPTMISGTNTRCPAIAIRVALIYAWDQGLSRQGQNWKIDRHTLKFAIDVAELHLKSVITLADRLAEHPDALLRRRIMKCFPEVEDVATLGEIILSTKLRPRNLKEIIEGLVIDGTLVEEQIANIGRKNRIYKRLR